MRQNSTSLRVKKALETQIHSVSAPLLLASYQYKYNVIK